MSDYETTQKRRNIIVGTFVMVAICALIWLILKFGELPMFFSQWTSFQVRVRFPTATGVEENTPVRFCGYQIGRVTKVKPPTILEDLNTGRSYHQTEVVLSIDNKYSDIPADVKVKLMTRGLGSSYIELKVPVPDNNEPRGVLTDESLLQGSTGITSEFFPEESQEKLDELVEDLKALIVDSRAIIGDPNNRENLKRTLANLSDASERAVKAIEEFEELSTAGTTILKNADGEVEKVTVALVDATEEISKMAAELRAVSEKINNGEGAIGKLVNDGRLYEGLLENTQQMQVLLQELESFIAESRSKGVPIKLK